MMLESCPNLPNLVVFNEWFQKLTVRINRPQFQTAVSDGSDLFTPRAEIDVLDRSNMSGCRGSKIVMIL